MTGEPEDYKRADHRHVPEDRSNATLASWLAVALGVAGCGVAVWNFALGILMVALAVYLGLCVWHNDA